MALLKEQIETILEEFKIENLEASPKPARATCPVAFWLPPVYKSKFDELQTRTDKKFGKALQVVVMNLIDSVE